MGFVVATASVNQLPLDWSGNTERLIGCVRTLADEPHPSGPPDVLLFPELAVSGYGCEDMFSAPAVLSRAMLAAGELAGEAARLLPGTAVIVGLPVRVSGQVYNCAVLLFGGRARGLVPKSRLAGDGVHYEPRWFAAYSPEAEAARAVEFLGAEVPFGRLLFGLRTVRFAIEICEDAWVADRPALDYAAAGCELILNPSASHFAFGKHAARRRIVLESSRAFGMGYVLVNLLGNEAGRMIYDGDAIAACAGELLLDVRPFSFGDRVLARVEIDPDRDRVVRARTFSMQSYRDARRAGRVESVPLFTDGGPAENAAGNSVAGSRLPRARPESSANIFEDRRDEFLRAVTLGLFDYWRKAHVQGLVISLSGGADSGACAVLAQRMLMYSFAELGPATALERLGIGQHIPSLSEAMHEGAHTLEECRSGDGLREAVRFVAGRVIHTIYQGTDNSGSVTRTAAARVAAALGVHHLESDIDDLVGGYRNRIETLLGRTLTWQNDDLALQNIQARVRSPLAWMLANVTGSLLVSTSNRSEAAVGYCTMDGDTSGGLAPLSGIDKAFLRNWLAWMETTGDSLGGAIPELEAITKQAPTAELRPAAAQQTDEADLMPYAVLDRIEKLAIRDRKPPLEVFRTLRRDNPDPHLRTYVRRFFVLWSQNQWKRERYAPSFHLDDENLDPRTWYRFPILSGGYRDELAELDREPE